jgi:hypothetical protein
MRCCAIHDEHGPEPIKVRQCSDIGAVGHPIRRGLTPRCVDAVVGASVGEAKSKTEAMRAVTSADR